MLPLLKKANYRGDYLLWLQFADGVEGVVDLEAELWGEVFEPLKEKHLFAAFELDPELNTVVWPNGADFAPEFLYQKLCPEYQLSSAPEVGAA